MENLQVIELQNKRVLTTKQISFAYETTEKLIRRNFENNKGRFVEGKHYICLTGEILKEFLQTQNLRLQNQSKVRHLYLWTEKGALLHAKSLNTDKAWEVYDYLVDFYFRVQDARQQAPARRGRQVVDIPVNEKAQELIRELKKRIAGMDTMLDLYNRYLPEEDYQKMVYAVKQIGASIADKAFSVDSIKPGLIEKS
jgi:hypothetical protein